MADNTDINNKTFTEKELESFKQKGYAGPFTLYDPEEMQDHFKRLRPKLLNNRTAAYQGLDGLSGVTNLSSYDRHLDIEFLADHISKEAIVRRLTQILGPDILCWRTEFFPKYPGDEGTDWHQAGNFSNVAASKKPQIEWPAGSQNKGTITVWTAITESTIDNGCMQFIPGTHRTMYYDESKVMDYDSNTINQASKNGIKRGFFGYDYRQLQIDPNWSPDESKAESMVMRPGQFFIFWSTLLHASHPHSGKTDDMRLGFATRYVPTSVKVYPHSESLDEFGGKANLDAHGCVLVAGENSYHQNRFVTQTHQGHPFTAWQAEADTEHQIAAIWRELFNLREVKASDDFFELGGNSLTALKFLSRIEEQYGEDALSPDALFENGGLTAVAEVIDSTCR
jgi:non-haem Fe2+, alpha-ketoglutarate-dependent halogenase